MGATVMVVDDDPVVLALVGILLTRYGYLTLRASTGHQALDMLDLHTPDLFILDFMMPGMDGAELCRRIRSRPATTQTPIIIFSAIGDLQNIQKLFSAGASEFFPKVKLTTDLITKVRQLIPPQTSTATAVG